jgi:hypothetical protein
MTSCGATIGNADQGAVAATARAAGMVPAACAPRTTGVKVGLGARASKPDVDELVGALPASYVGVMVTR